MIPPDQSSDVKPHPIQVGFIAIRELSIITRRPPTLNESFNDVPMEFEESFSEIDENKRTFQVGLAVEIGKDSEGRIPFHVRVKITAEFKIVDEKLSMQKAASWANRGSSYVLFPFLREHVFALTARAGFNPVLLPLLQVPTFNYQGAETALSP